MRRVAKDLSILNPDVRKFTVWASVEAKDRQGDIIPISELAKVMDTWMDRGAPMTDSHSNRVIGKGLNWELKEKNGRPGVLLTGKIYSDYEADNEVWRSIKSGDYTGASIGGGSNMEKQKSRMTDDGEANVLENIELYEVSLCKRPANQEAVFEEINMMAKSDVMKKGKRYISDPSQAPEGAKVQQGARGGYYYELEGVGGDETPKKPRGRAHRDENAQYDNRQDAGRAEGEYFVERVTRDGTIDAEQLKRGIESNRKFLAEAKAEGDEYNIQYYEGKITAMEDAVNDAYAQDVQDDDNNNTLNRQNMLDEIERSISHNEITEYRGNVDDFIRLAYENASDVDTNYLNDQDGNPYVDVIGVDDDDNMVFRTYVYPEDVVKQYKKSITRTACGDDKKKAGMSEETTQYGESEVTKEGDIIAAYKTMNQKFAGYNDFPSCVKAQIKQGKEEEEAVQVCAYLQDQFPDMNADMAIKALRKKITGRQ